MSRPLFRILVSGKAAKFQALAVVPGQLMLDRWNATDKLLAAWLGRFVAKADWHDNVFRFFLRNEQGQQLVDFPCEPVVAAELRGKLKREFAALQGRLKQAQPASASEKPLYDVVCKGLLTPQPGSDYAALNCQFFKYKDLSGATRLVWCYGYEPTVKRGDASPLICPLPDCLLLQMRHPGLEPTCLHCNQPFPVPVKPPRSKKFLWAALLLLLLGVATGGYFYASAATLVGRVLRGGDNQPVANAVVYVDGFETKTQTDANGEFKLPGLRWGARTVFAKAPGYQDLELPMSLSGRENTVELKLAGAAQVVGQVVYRSGDKLVPVAEAEVKPAGVEGQVVTTDAEGRFQLAGLMPGPTPLAIKAAGFADHELSAEASVEAATPLEVHLVGTGKLVGQVVYDADSKTPIAKAEIVPVGFDGAPVRSDSEGKFRFDNLPPADAKLKVMAAGFHGKLLPIKRGTASALVGLAGDAIITGEVLRTDTKSPVANAEVQIPGTPYTARTNEKGAFRIEEVRSGPARLTAQSPGLVGTATQDLLAQQTTAVKIFVAGSLTATGRVVDAVSEEPVAGATITVADTNLKARSDAQGRYTLPGLAEGTSKIVVSAAGFLPRQADVSPSPAQLTFDDIKLEPATTLEGRVLSSKNQKPLANAEVSFGKDGPKTTTNAEGLFVLTPLPTGKGQLTISAPDHFSLQLKPEFAAGEQTMSDILLPMLAKVQGFVRRAVDQAPIEGAVVALNESGEKVVTKADGSYEIARAPAGQVFMASHAPGYEKLLWRPTLVPGTQQLGDILLEGNSLAKGMTINGSEEGRWVEGVELVVTAGKFQKTLKSDSKGTFEIGKLPPGPVVVKAKKPGFAAVEVTKTIKPGDAEIEVPLFPLMEASGVVTNALRKPNDNLVEKAEVEITSAAGKHKAVTGKDGTFKIAGVAAGPVTVSIKAPGYATALLDRKLLPKGPRLELTLQPFLVVKGTIVDADKPQQAEANAKVTAKVGEISETVTSDRSGGFVVRLPAGKVTGSAAAAGYCETPIAATITAAKPTLEIRMPAGRTLSGQVINAVNNQPIAGALIEIEGADAQKLRATSNDSGAFEIQSVPVSAKAAKVTAQGFEPLRAELLAVGKSLRLVLSPELLPGEVRLVLTWAEKPRDMDSHLYGPPIAGKPLHISFKNRTAAGATLDVDSKEGLGPETITIKSPGKYSYFVAHPENLGSSDGKGLTNSAAEVRVYAKGVPGISHRLPTKIGGPLWHVLDVTIDAAGKVTIERKDAFQADLPPE